MTSLSSFKKIFFIELIILCARIGRDGDGEKGLRPHRSIIGCEPHDLLTISVIHLHHSCGQAKNGDRLFNIWVPHRTITTQPPFDPFLINSPSFAFSIQDSNAFSPSSTASPLPPLLRRPHDGLEPLTLQAFKYVPCSEP